MESQRSENDLDKLSIMVLTNSLDIYEILCKSIKRYLADLIIIF